MCEVMTVFLCAGAGIAPGRVKLELSGSESVCEGRLLSPGVKINVTLGDYRLRRDGGTGFRGGAAANRTVMATNPFSNPQTGPEPDEAAGGLSWESGPEGRGLRGVISTCGAILLRPNESLHRTRLSGELWNAFAFYLGMMMAATLISSLMSRMMFTASMAELDQAMRGLENVYPPETVGQIRRLLGFLAGPSPVSLLFSLTFWFMFFTFYVFAAGAFLHLCLMMVGGASGGFEASFKALAYSHGATAPLLVVPFCGGLLHLVWLSVVLVVALVEWHRTSTVRVVLGLSLPVIPLFCCFGAVLAWVMSQASGMYAGY